MINQGMRLLIKDLRLLQGLTQEQLAEKAGVSRPYLTQLETGAKTINGHRLDQVAKALGVQARDLIAGDEQTVPVKGCAGAGAEVMPFNDHASGQGMYDVECPSQLFGANVVAVEVSGTSMEPVYIDGDILFYTRDTHGIPTEAVGAKCVCEDDTGHVWVKQVKAGSEPGLFNLLSINPTGANMHNVRLKWAAPVRLHLPKEFVRRT